MNLNESDFRTLLDTTNGYVVADFGASWCNACRNFAPIFTDIAKHFPKVKFVNLDVDECKQLCEDLNITIVPTVILFRSAKVIARTEGGFDSVAAFSSWLKSQQK